VTAVVLGSVDLGESDRLMHLLSRERGRVTARARHARRSRKRYGGRLDRYSLVRAQLRLRRDRAALGEVDLLEPFLGIRTDLLRTAMADHLVELLRIATHEEEECPELFGLAVRSLEVLDRSPEPPGEGWLRAVVMGVLEASGLALAVEGCCACGGLVERFPAGFAAGAGGVLCADHAATEPGCAPLSRVDLEQLRGLAAADLADPGGCPAVGRPVRRLLARFCEFHLGRQLRTASFVDSLLDEPG